MTTNADTSAASTSTTSTRSALIPRLGSLLAFVPLGVWTTWHLWDNTYAFRGAEAWQSRVAADRGPFVEWITLIVVLLPLVLHTVWGIRRLFIMRANNARYATFDNLKFLLQRLSALGLVAFLPAHIYLARIEPAMRTHGGHENFALLASTMHHHMPTLIVYVLGVLATAYHLGNGVGTGGMTWGYAASPKAMRRLSAWSIGFFLLLLALGWGAVYALYDAGTNLPFGNEAAAAGGDAMPTLVVPPPSQP